MTHDLPGLEDLARHRNRLLAAMSILSDASAALWVSGKKRANKSHTVEPRHVHEPLFDKWRGIFEDDWPDVPDDPDQAALDWCYERAYKLVLNAEADLKWARGELDVTATAADSDAREKRIVKQHEGRPAVEVAHLERCSTASVRAIRRQFGRDAMFGRPGDSCKR